MTNIETGLQEIFSMADYLDKKDRKLVEKSYYFAKEAHKDQKRKSGEPYFIHLIETAKNLASIKMDAVSIAAGLLHDSIEDGVATDEQIKKEFGEEIYFLVNGVTKLEKVRYHGMDRHNESLKKLFIATSKDIRVAIVKFADRLHNIQTLEHVKPEKQYRIAKETLDIYAPLAYRLGITAFSKQLEDYAFPYVYPEAYKKVKELLNERKKQDLKYIEKITKSIKKKLAENNILEFKTKFRIKGVYSLYKKLKKKEWDINKIHDVAALRIITSDIGKCYQILGVIHQNYKPMPGRIKDYIALPKTNGYQSIHTTVFSGDGGIVEIQIRTSEMDNEAELGAASHIGYKEKHGGVVKSDWFSVVSKFFKNDNKIKDNINKKDKHLWINDLADSEIENNEELIEDQIGDDYFGHRIFVFTPIGDVIDLPEGSTPVDFAFMVHTDLGYKISGVKINGHFKALGTELKNGDILEIETKKNEEPNIKWLEFVKTNLAKRKIKSYFDKKKRLEKN